MGIQMSQIPINQILLDSDSAKRTGDFEFTIDCGAIYFGAVYDGEGKLQTIDQYFYTQSYSRDDLKQAIGENQLLSVDDKDFLVKTYLLSKMEDNREWLRFHAITPQKVNTEYFYQKYFGE